MVDVLEGLQSAMWGGWVLPIGRRWGWAGTPWGTCCGCRLGGSCWGGSGGGGGRA